MEDMQQQHCENEIVNKKQERNSKRGKKTHFLCTHTHIALETESGTWHCACKLQHLLKKKKKKLTATKQTEQMGALQQGNIKGIASHLVQSRLIKMATTCSYLIK